MGLNDHLIEKMSNALLSIGINDDLVDKLESYMVGEIGEEEFFSSLPQIDMSNISKDAIEQISSAYKSIERHKANEYMGSYIRMLFKIGGKTTFTVIDNFMYSYYYYKKENCKKLLEYGVKPTFVIAYYADAVVYSENTLEIGFVDFFDGLYEKHRDEFKEALEMVEVNQRGTIAAYLIKKEGNKESELCEWLDSVIINSIGILFDRNISDHDNNIIREYLNGTTSNIEEIIEILRSKIALKMDNYILKFLMGTSYLIVDESDVAKRFLKFVISFKYIQSIQLLHDFLKVQRYNRITKLIDKIGVKMELYIAWIGSKSSSYTSGYEKDLKEVLATNKGDFIKAINLCQGFSKAYMASFLFKQGEGLEFVGEVEDSFIEEFSKFMDELNVEKSIYERFIDYFRDRTSFESIKESLEGLFGKKEFYIYGRDYTKVLVWLRDVSPMFEKGMKVFIAMGNAQILSKLYNEFKEKDKSKLSDFVELLERHGASIDNFLTFIATYAITTYGDKGTLAEAKNIITKLIAKDEEKVIKAVENCNAEIRAYLLDKLFEANKEKNFSVLIDYLGDSSKVVREKVVDLLTEYKEVHEQIIPSLSAKKLTIRECAVTILSKNKSEKIVEELSKTLETEKSEKVKTLLREVLNLESDLSESNEGVDILEYCKKAVKGNKAAGLKWLDFDTLPKVKLKESEKLAEDEIVKYLLLCYSSQGTVALSTEGKRIGEFLNKQDLGELTLQVLERWMNLGAEVKKKWVLAFSSIHGDYRTILQLKKNIDTWAENSRGAIAAEAVKALALNGSNEALIMVDNMSRKYKFKQVKNAATAALEFAAKELGLDKEELSDKIVPDLDFDIRGERIFDFGERKFKVVLTPELTVEVYDESDKKIKNLPAPNKKDDEAKASAAILEFKALKKQLKTVVSIQSIRLEMALSTNRKWTKEAWVKLFVENPIMHQFATGLVWGVYEKEVLTDTFRYMEDGTFNTKDEDEYEIVDSSTIGIVHPIELDEEDLNLWKEQLENYEIKQPFDQINREIFKVTEEEKGIKRVERFGGTMLNGLSLLGKLTGFGWYRGSILDGGGYYTFYKEDKTLNIGVELAFSGVSVGYENEEVTLYGLTFYKGGTVERGSYIYDKVKNQNLIIPSEVPERFFSEILYQINKISAAKTEINDNWRSQE